MGFWQVGRYVAGTAFAALAALTPTAALRAPLMLRPAPCESVGDAPAWRRVDAPGPPARALHAAAFDRARGLAVVFGGVRADLGVLGDVWAFSPFTEIWQEIVLSGDQPSPRWASAAVEDASRARILVLFGNDGQPREDVWALDLGQMTWQQLPAGPPARFDAAVTTDGADRLWVYGGFPWSPARPDAVLGDLWEFDMASTIWRQRHVAATLPLPAQVPLATTNASLAFHDEALYLVGGHTAAAVTPGTWRYDLATGNWHEVPAAGAPAAWTHQARASDDVCKRLLLAGGDNADERDVSYLEALQLGHDPSFVRLPGELPAVSRHHSAMALDPVSRQLILFGGWQGSGVFLEDTWLYPLGYRPG